MLHGPKHEIEDYKSHTIYYYEDENKFACDISIEDNFKEVKRSNLKDVRKEIDQFIKENLNFKPFKALMTDKYGDHEVKVVEVTAIRTDGKLVVKERLDSKSQSFYGAEEAKRLMKFDADLVEAQKAADEEYDKAYKVKKSKMAALMKKLVPLDFTNYNLK
jgi:hypothetical protein